MNVAFELTRARPKELRPCEPGQIASTAARIFRPLSTPAQGEGTEGAKNALKEWTTRSMSRKNSQFAYPSPRAHEAAEKTRAAAAAAKMRLDFTRYIDGHWNLGLRHYPYYPSPTLRFAKNDSMKEGSPAESVRRRIRVGSPSRILLTGEPYHAVHWNRSAQASFDHLCAE
jgi:hypothetical protein